ncbi:methyl-accepting chemotaxis protein [Terasakiella pusilla]|jgi:methyl-accepting chemotaxis protein|uniref:methyl-accepting chemotaxis protein n=1 Tax=Terasakiella pusilla TaxID=64973 RepID=UPI00048FF653|nr:cache domain-containing protein [Terasakiella pusilla]
MVVDKLKVASKIWLPAIIFSIALIAVAAISAQTFNRTLLQDRQDKVRTLVETAYSIVEHYSELAKVGTLPEEEAKTLAKETIRSIRYDKTEYFWINDLNQIMLMHPISTKLEGKNLSTLEDKTGKKFFAEFTTIVKANPEGGFVNYFWPKAGFEEPVEKISYVKLSKEWGWIIGTGLYIDDVDTAFWAEFKVFASIVIVTLVVAGAISWMVAKSLSNGLTSLAGQMSVLASGDNTIEITGQSRVDEIGDMAKAVEVFKQNAQENDRMRVEQEDSRQRQAQERKSSLLTLADELQTRMRGVIDNMAGTVQSVGTSAVHMYENADKTNQQSTEVSSISEQTSANVQTVAAAAEELNASSSEIGRQVEHTNQTVQAAASEADQTNIVIQGLSGAAAKIGEVVNMIQNIAEQTNLLALNATIEAARAGEAGKGFAVVASEVKNLANQTAKATDEVSQQIATIQNETDRAVEAIKGISSTINDVHDASGAIAAAVEEQHAAIQEISRNVQEAARGTQEISNHIAAVSEDAHLTMTSANEVKDASASLTHSAQELDTTMQSLLNDMREKANHG